MDKQRMIFEADRRTVTEGDIIEIHWQCPEADTVKLTIDNGYRTADMPLSAEGSKRLRLNRSKGKTHLVITVSIMGKEYHKKIDVRVKKMPTAKAETIDSQGRRQGRMAQWWQGVLTKWHDLRARVRYSLQALPEKKQMAVKILAVIGVMLILSAIWPRLYPLTLAVVAAYLTVVLVRR